MRPRISSTSRRVMTRPMPVPSTLLRSAPSRLNGWNSCSRWASLRPGPVSATLSTTVSPSRWPRTRDVAAGPVVLDRIRQQVHQHLAQPHAVALHMQRRVGRVGDRHTGVAGAAGDEIDGLRRDCLQIERLDRQCQRPRFDARQVEHVVDHGQQVQAGPFDVLHPFALRAGERLAAVHAQQLREAEHRVQRRAQLMAHARQEFGLRGIGALGRCGGDERLLVALALGDVLDEPSADCGRPASSRSSVNVTAPQTTPPSRRR